MIKKTILEVGMKAHLQQLLEHDEIPFSERNFSTIFLYRDAHSWEIVSSKDDKQPLGFIGKTYDDQKCFFPLDERFLYTKDFTTVISQLIETENVTIIYPLTEKTARALSVLGHHICISADDSDYIMSRKSIETYAGRSLDGRRNLVHQFLRLGAVEMKAITENTISDAIEVLDTWDKHTQERTDLDSEKKASREGLFFYKELSINGWITYLDKKPVAVWYGQSLNHETYLVHCAKAIPHLKGAYQYIHQQATQKLASQYIFLNWEQDLGLPGLRKSKLSYDPIRFEHKWRLNLSTEKASLFYSPI